MMKKIILFMVMICLLLTGCDKAKGGPDAVTKATEKVNAETEEKQETTQQEQSAVTVNPLADPTMDNLTDATLAISLEEGGAYVDDTGKMQMDLKIYTYDKYDMVDISALKVGDTLVTHNGEVEVASVDQNENGTIYINGGLEEGGFDLVTDDSGVYFETGFNDAKNWYEVGEATIRVSADFVGKDNADMEKGEIILYPGSFLTGEVENYDFTPYNTTVRVEDGQIVEMTRIFVP